MSGTRQPQIGGIVIYKLSQEDVEEIRNLKDNADFFCCSEWVDMPAIVQRSRATNEADLSVFVESVVFNARGRLQGLEPRTWRFP